MDDEARLQAFTEAAWRPEDFTHAERIRLCYLLTRAHPVPEAERRLRRGLKHLFHTWGVRQTAESGYHETRDQAWLSVVRGAARPMPADSDALLATHPELLDERLLERHYSPERLTISKGRRTRLPPDRRPLPKDYIDAVDFPWELTLRPIGVVESDYRERHGTPRQATVSQPREAVVHLFEDVLPPRALADLEGFERIWLLSWFHLNHGWNPTVHPPRGGQRRSVLATRAPHRPNPIGLSAVQLVGVQDRLLRVRGCDLLHGTPILDVKPYVPYADAFPDASAGWVDELADEDDRANP